DGRGQRVSACDRLYLAAGIATLIVWGERDPIIPVCHAHEAHRAIPGSRLQIFADAGHFPHPDDPPRLVRLRAAVTPTAPPTPVGATEWRTLLQRGAGAPAGR